MVRVLVGRTQSYPNLWKSVVWSVQFDIDEHDRYPKGDLVIRFRVRAWIEAF